jgi:hypothetical protein
VFLFVPLGIGLVLSGLSGKRVLLVVCALSGLIEAAQFLTIPGRDAAIGDVLSNILGGAVGLAVARYATRWLRPPPRLAKRLAMGWATIWLAIQIVSNFSFAPSLPDSQYYGQIARVFWNFAVFPGAVISASIGDVRIPNTALTESHRARRLLLEGATVATTVVPAELTLDVAPIVRVVDGKKNEIVLLAQNGESLVFGIHTGAAVLRLRPLLFALPGVFPAPALIPSSDADTLTLSGRYAPSSVRMNTESRSATQERSIPLTTSLGWTLWLPFQWFIEGTRLELVVSWIWLTCLAMPLGFWFVSINDPWTFRERFRHWVPVVLAGSVLLCAGLVAVPIAFGLSPASLADWLATLAGIVVGGGLGALKSHACRTHRVASASPQG